MFGEKDPQDSVGASGLGIWRFRTEIVAPPGSGQIRFNNADPSLATTMWIHETNNTGSDMAGFLNLVSAGDVFYIQDRADATRFITIQVSSNVDSGVYRTFGITQIVVQGAAMGQNTQVGVVISGEGFASAATTYLRLDATNGPLTGPLVSQQISPDVDQSRDLGTTTNKFDRAFAGIGVFAKGDVNSAVTFPSLAGHGGLIAGTIVGAGGTEQMILNHAVYPAIACIGNVKAPAGAAASLEATRGGAIAMGSAFAYNLGTHRVQSSGYSSFAAGYAYGNGASYLQATGSASIAIGYANGRSTAGSATARLRSRGSGSFAAGFVRTFSGSGSALLDAQGNGSFCQGYIRTNGANNGTIQATGEGSFAQGSSRAGIGGVSLISATGRGSFAVGYAGPGQTIAATAQGAVQFGPGTNALADSLQVGGAGIRFKGTAGAPAAPQNGDFWRAGVFVYVRSNGVSIQIAGPGPLTN